MCALASKQSPTILCMTEDTIEDFFLLFLQDKLICANKYSFVCFFCAKFMFLNIFIKNICKNTVSYDGFILFYFFVKYFL